MREAASNPRKFAPSPPATLEASAWCFWRSKSFREAMLLAVNLGDDADTTGAVCGQIAGAFYGEHGIPPEWLSRLVMVSEIRLTKHYSGPRPRLSLQGSKSLRASATEPGRSAA
jgi:hypothetical protein